MTYRKRQLYIYTLAGMLLALISSNVYCLEPLPTEIRALIGLKIPPKTKQVQVLIDRRTGKTETRQQNSSGDIPWFTPINGSLLSYDKNSYSLALDEGFVGKTPVLIISRIGLDLSLEIIDAAHLPPELVEWRLVHGKIVHLHGRYRLSESCEYVDSSRNAGGHARLIGLVMPERGKSDCSHDSGRVRRAWGIGMDGHLKVISTDGLKCHYTTMNDC